MKQVGTLTNHDELPQASFVALWAFDKPWRDYPGMTDEQKNTEVPIVLMLNRWDGSIGFPGGKVDGEETPFDAVLREMQEEIHYVVPEHRHQQMVPVCSHQFSIVTHLYALRLTPSVLRIIAAEAIKSQHFGTEVSGVMLAQLGHYPNGKGLQAFLKNNFASSVREELDEFIRYTKRVKAKDEEYAAKSQ